MHVIPLAAAPNQSFTFAIDQTRWVVRLVETRGVMAADLSRSGEPLLTGVRVVAGEPIIPYRAQQTFGNFIFITVDGDAPDWRQFGQTQTLVYLSALEAAALPAVTAGDYAALTPVSYLTSDDGFYLTTDTGELLTDD